MTKILIDREGLIRMAHEAEQPTKTCWLAYEVEFLERFAALVAEYEREQCAKVCEEEAKQFMQCAGSLNTGPYDWKADGAEDCAESIRARSNR